MNDTVLKVAVCNHRDDWRYKNVELTGTVFRSAPPRLSPSIRSCQRPSGTI